MELFLLVLALLLIAVLAPTFGRDSRNIDDDAWSRDDLWSRSPQPRV
jgi:hypothetical protein